MIEVLLELGGEGGFRCGIRSEALFGDGEGDSGDLTLLRNVVEDSLFPDVFRRGKVSSLFVLLLFTPEEVVAPLYSW